MQTASISHLPARRPAGALVLACTTALLIGGCATAQRPDPLEPVNRQVFAFNEGLDRVVLKPVATAYQTVVPQPVRHGVTRFFSNAKDPWSAVNLMLQGRVKDGLSDIGRFATNTVVGVLGLVDFASDWGMPHHGEDFGQTLGVWGVGTGAYLVLPLLGPSNLRDASALPVDSLGQLSSLIQNGTVSTVVQVTQKVDGRARLLSASALVDEAMLDKYGFMRDAYLLRRRSLVEDALPQRAPSAIEPAAAPGP